jgi:hypothetical protein
MQDKLRVGCLNGDHLECVRILHIGESGEVVGPAAAGFPNQSVAGLLDAWLNDGFFRMVDSDLDKPDRVRVPHLVEGAVLMI